jgi:hypothetical protein
VTPSPSSIAPVPAETLVTASSSITLSATPAVPTPSTAPTNTAPISVSRAGIVLDPTAAAEANRRDNTATRALSNAQIKAADGNCLTINPLAGDFRQNLIPVE